MTISLFKNNNDDLKKDDNENVISNINDNVSTLAQLIQQKQEETFTNYVKNLKDAQPPDNKEAEIMEVSVRVNVPQQKMFRMFLHALLQRDVNKQQIEAISLVTYEEKLDKSFINYMKEIASRILGAGFPKVPIFYKLAPPLETVPTFNSEITMEDIVYFVRFLGLGKYPFAYDAKRFMTNQVIIDLIKQSQQILADHDQNKENPKVHLKFNSKVFRTIDGSLGQEYIKGLFQLIGLLSYGMDIHKAIVNAIINNGKMVPQKDRIMVLQQFVSGKRHSPAQILSVATQLERASIRYVLGLDEENLIKVCDNFKKVIERLKLNPSDPKAKENDKKIQELMKKVPYPVYACLYARIRARNNIIKARKSELLLQLNNQKKNQNEISMIMKKQRFNISLNDLFKNMTQNRCAPLHINPYHLANICYSESSAYDDILATSSNTNYYFIDSTGIYRPKVEYLQYIVDSTPEDSLAKQAQREIVFIQQRVNSLAQLQMNVSSFENKQDIKLANQQNANINKQQPQSMQQYTSKKRTRPNKKGSQQGAPSSEQLGDGKEKEKD